MILIFIQELTVPNMREEVSKEDFEGEVVDLVPGRKKFVIFSMEI